MSLFEILGTVKQHNVVTRDHTNTQHMLSSLKLQTWLSSPFSHQMFVAHTWHQHVTSLSISCTDNPLTSHTLARLHQKDLEHVQQKKKKKKTTVTCDPGVAGFSYRAAAAPTKPRRSLEIVTWVVRYDTFSDNDTNQALFLEWPLFLKPG